MSNNIDKSKNFNLLSSININLSKFDRIYLWLNTRVKLLFIIIYIFTILVFGLKVVEDINAKNLDKIIDQNNSKLAFFAKDAEPLVRKIHKKEFNYIEIWKNSKYIHKVLQEIYGFVDIETGNKLNIQIIGNNTFISIYEQLDKLSVLERSLKQNSEMIYKNTVKVSELIASLGDIGIDAARIAVIGTLSNKSNRNFNE